MSAPLLSNIVMTSSWPNNAASVNGVLPKESLTCKFASASSNADKLSLSLSHIKENIDMSLLDRLCSVIALLSVVFRWYLIRNSTPSLCGALIRIDNVRSYMKLKLESSETFAALTSTSTTL